jgi:hypothetical protein
MTPVGSGVERKSVLPIAKNDDSVLLSDVELQVNTIAFLSHDRVVLLDANQLRGTFRMLISILISKQDHTASDDWTLGLS